MSDYRLTITRIDANPEYSAVKAHESMMQMRHGMAYGGQPYTVQPKMETGVLDVVVTEEEWARIKQAVIYGWK